MPENQPVSIVQINYPPRAFGFIPEKVVSTALRAPVTVIEAPLNVTTTDDGKFVPNFFEDVKNYKRPVDIIYIEIDKEDPNHWLSAPEGGVAKYLIALLNGLRTLETENLPKDIPVVLNNKDGIDLAGALFGSERSIEGVTVLTRADHRQVAGK